MEFRIFDDLDQKMRNDWSEFVFNHPYGNFFQCPFAYDLFKNSGEFEPFCFIILNDSSQIIALHQCVIWSDKKKISGKLFPKIISWGGPLISDTGMNDEVFQFLFGKTEKFLESKAVYIEYRNFFDTSFLKNTFAKHDFHYKPFLNYKLILSEKNKIINNFSNSKQRQIKKSVKSGVNITEAVNPDEIRQYYKILSGLYRKKVSKPLPSFSFFIKLFNFSKISKSAVFLLVKHNDKIIGGSVCLIFLKKTIYEWYICGMDNEYRKEGVYPSVMATWAIIEFGLNNGISELDFMGIGRADKKYGVREFKTKFGGDIFEYGRYLKVNKKLLYFFGKTGLKVNEILTRIFHD